jgi:UDP-GlcNAc:undecaprenyl-phosphate GlcNAc-1-phosphate transferase
MIIRTVVYTCVACGLTSALLPFVIILCKKNRWYDKVNSRKVHNGNIPRLGGLGFVPVFIVAAFLYAGNLDQALFTRTLPVFAAGFMVFLLGVIDDFRELPAGAKLAGQCLVSVIPVVFGFHFSRFGPLHFGPAGPVITFIWFVGIINAFNLIDGVDALCGSLAFLVMLAIGIMQISIRNGAEYAGFAFILCGCILGFLFYNRPKAVIFMGDGGSQFLGFMIAALPLLTVNPASGRSFRHSVGYNVFPMMVVITAIPLLDTVAAIWRRVREGRSFFSPDKVHLHHKLLSMGYTTKSILVFLLGIQIGVCAFSLLAAVKIRGMYGFTILCGVFASMLVFFSIIHYTYRAVARVKRRPDLVHPEERGRGTPGKGQGAPGQGASGQGASE